MSWCIRTDKRRGGSLTRPVSSFLLATASMALLLLSAAAGPAAQAAERTIIGQPAPDFVGAKGWLNTDKPISMKDLRGKVVLLDFWTYCCINCMHAIPTLKALEAKFPNELAVVGVHSGKFNNEKDLENIRKAVARYNVRHPVVNDPEMTVWGAFEVDSWPFFVLIDPSGKVVATYRGEPSGAMIQQVESLIATSKAQKTIKKPLAVAAALRSGGVAEKDKIKKQPLMFPGKIVAYGSRKLLVLSDSGHNQVIGTNLEGKVQFTIGSGAAGMKDGSFAEAQLNGPQGVALNGDDIYIADTENHAIRVANLKTRKVTTVAGTGTQGQIRQGGPARSVALSSPWDLLLHNKNLFIAMAGFHQLWKLDLNTKQISPWSGTGKERIKDGDATTACYSQPSGLTTDGKSMFVADSESSAIRQVDLSNGSAKTLIGRGLFDFGDVDGKLPAVRLQHPLAVLWLNNVLYVADSYNHKIKIISPTEKSSKTFLGTGKAGHAEGSSPSFSEPAGLAGINGKSLLFVADTNNHAIRVVDLKNRKVSTLKISVK